jgi:Tol biopolymer transport system component
VLRTAPNDDEANIWIYDLPSGPLSPLTRGGGISGLEWSADGQRVAYTRGQDLLWRRFDASDDEELLLRRERTLAQIALTPDKVLYQESPGSWDIGVATIGTPGSDSLILRGEYWEGVPAVSPDGRLLAYYSAEGGSPQIFVQPLLRPGRKVQISSGGTVSSSWAGDSRRLYYVERGTLMEATLTNGSDVGLAAVNRLFDLDGWFDVFPDGELFAVLAPVAESAARREITVVSNFDLLLRRAGAR